MLLGGEPGAGKSTLLLQAAHSLAGRRRTVLYACAEESPSQVRLRAERLGALAEGVLISCEVDVATVLEQADACAPDLLVIDSIQTMRDPDVAGAPGGVTQVRECAARVVSAAKERGLATILVGHVTKDGQLAGPRTLEHLVDAVLELSGDRHHALRLLRAAKNRFGPVGEVGCFEMTGAGMEPVADAGRLFVGEAVPGTTGVVVTLALEGTRPLACEVQALVGDAEKLANPRRVASGLDPARLALLVAVLERHGKVKATDRDVYASTVGGLRLTEPALDLALCVALASSAEGRSTVPGLVALGEVGLAGEVRQVAQTERRLMEAARMGFETALLPAAYDGPASGLRLLRARDLRSALDLGLVARTDAPLTVSA